MHEDFEIPVKPDIEYLNLLLKHMQNYKKPPKYYRINCVILSPMQDNENLICIISKYLSTLLLISKRWLNILFFLLHELLSLRMLYLEVVGST